MKQFNYTITDPLGIHARPAGLLAKAAKTFPDTVIMIQKGDKEVKATQLMKLMGLGVKEGDVVEANQPVATIEAMKMETNILAAEAGIVEKIYVSEGQQVKAGEMVAKLKK